MLAYRIYRANIRGVSYNCSSNLCSHATPAARVRKSAPCRLIYPDFSASTVNSQVSCRYWQPFVSIASSPLPSRDVSFFLSLSLSPSKRRVLSPTRTRRPILFMRSRDVDLRRTGEKTLRDMRARHSGYTSRRGRCLTRGVSRCFYRRNIEMFRT